MIQLVLSNSRRELAFLKFSSENIFDIKAIHLTNHLHRPNNETRLFSQRYSLQCLLRSFTALMYDPTTNLLFRHSQGHCTTLDQKLPVT